MEKLESFEEYEKVKKEGMKLYYISHEECNVCKVLLPRLEKILDNYKKVQPKYVDVHKIPMIKGELSAFTVPTIVVTLDGKEIIRESRYIQLDGFQDKLERYYEFV